MAALAMLRAKAVAAPLAAVMRVVEIPFAAAERRFGRRGLPWLFLAPNLLVFSIFAFLPLILNVFYALSGGEQVMLGSRPNVGLDNFRYLFACGDYLDPNSCRADLFWRAVWNTVLFVCIQTGLMVGISLLTAIVLNRPIRGRGFFRAVFFFPVLLSPVVVALVWKWMLQREGLFNAWRVDFGLDPIIWLISPNWAFGWSIFITIWAHMGFYTLILLAGLQAIPSDVYEAAVMDGARPFRIFRKITLPLLAPTMLVALVLALIRSVQTFDELYAFTGGGPGSATTLVIQYIYETGFAGAPRLLGLAAAASILVALVLVVLTAIQLWVNRRSVNG